MSELLSAPAPGSPSTQAYLAVIGSTSALFCTVGFVVAFGVFQTYYKEQMLHDMTEFDISWIGSTAIFLLYISAPGCGVLVDRYGPKTLLISGSIGVLAGIFMTSLCAQYYQFFLAQAVLLGISMGFVTWPPMAVVSRHLPQHRGLALGFVTGGSSLGGIIWPVMIEQLLTTRNLGFPWTMRVVGFTMLPLLAIACLFVVEPQKVTEPEVTYESTAPEGGLTITSTPLPKPEENSLSLFKRPVFIALCFGFGFGFLGLFIPIFYVSSYASSHGASAHMAFYMISVVNGSSLLGRIIPGYLADRVGHYNVMVLLLLLSGVIAFSWTAVSDLAGLIVWSTAYGFFSGAILSLQGACVGKIATPQNQGKAIGFLQGCLAITVLVGSPVGGQLLGKYGYLSLAIFTGTALITGSMVMVYARLCLDRRLMVAV